MRLQATRAVIKLVSLFRTGHPFGVLTWQSAPGEASTCLLPHESHASLACRAWRLVDDRNGDRLVAMVEAKRSGLVKLREPIFEQVTSTGVNPRGHDRQIGDHERSAR
jgi:hypothetical protein